MYGNSGSGSGSASAGQQSQQSRHNALPTGAPEPVSAFCNRLLSKDDIAEMDKVMGAKKGET